MRVLVFDPGESTGWVFRGSEILEGGTCGKDHREVALLIVDKKPDIIVFEKFALYPGMAKSLAWNTFYPCEVIGVIRYLCEYYEIPYISVAASVKKYAGGFSESWKSMKLNGPLTEHVKDSYLLLRYFERNLEEKRTL